MFILLGLSRFQQSAKEVTKQKATRIGQNIMDVENTGQPSSQLHKLRNNPNQGNCGNKQ